MLFFSLVKPYFFLFLGKLTMLNILLFETVYLKNPSQLTVCLFLEHFSSTLSHYFIFVIKTTFFHSSGCFISAWSVQPRAVTTDRCLTTKMLLPLNLCVCASIYVTCMCLRAVENPLAELPEWARCAVTDMYTQLLCG